MAPTKYKRVRKCSHFKTKRGAYLSLALAASIALLLIVYSPSFTTVALGTEPPVCEEGLGIETEPICCGNGITEPGAGEECDDGNTTPGDGCDENCLLECGNGQLDRGEECDDEGTRNGDGCDENCQLECGNGQLDPNEQCDDGKQCSLGEPDCTDDIDCENSVPAESGPETENGVCKPQGGDGCDVECQLECGNGEPDPNEECDDGKHCVNGLSCQDECDCGAPCGNAAATVEPPLDTSCELRSDDGCSDQCIREFCGDGIVTPNLQEQCDNGGVCSDSGAPCTSDAECLLQLPPNGPVGPTTEPQCDHVDDDPCCDVECQIINDQGRCDDGFFCRVDEVCLSGQCRGSQPRDCSSESDACNDGVCNEESDRCEKQPANLDQKCADDQNPCTIDKCIEFERIGICEKFPVDGGCSLENFCTINDFCEEGRCQGGPPRDCSGLNTQCLLGVCDEETDACIPSPTNIGQSCDDGGFCTTGELCDEAGECTGGPPTDCSELDDICNDGTCNEETDQCEAVPIPEEEVGELICGIGECANSIPECIGSDLQECGEDDEGQPGIHTCNGLDNDCDGVIDDEEDNDKDGVLDCNDNCPTVANPGQEDTFGKKGFGDACDVELEDLPLRRPVVTSDGKGGLFGGCDENDTLSLIPGASTFTASGLANLTLLFSPLLYVGVIRRRRRK